MLASPVVILFERFAFAHISRMCLIRLAEGMNVTVPSVCAFERSTIMPRPMLL